MQVHPSVKNAVQYCQLAKVRTWLGLEAGGGDALLMLAFLVGGDYHTGAEKVGLRSAFSAVQHLLKGQQARLSPTCCPYYATHLRGTTTSAVRMLIASGVSAARCKDILSLGRETQEIRDKGDVSYTANVNLKNMPPPPNHIDTQRL